MSGFDPAALHGLADAFDSESVVIDLDSEDIRRISSADVRRRCSGLKLAAQIIGLATAESIDLDDAEVLRSMSRIMDRLGVLRQAGLAVIGADSASPDFPLIFNSVTNSMLSAVAEEWRWGKLAPNKARALKPALIAKLLDMATKGNPEWLKPKTEGFDLGTVRRLAILDATPKVYSLTNLFDYYQNDPEAMVVRLLRCAADQAEWHAQLVIGSMEYAPDVAHATVLERMYGISVSLMREIYKMAAYRDVQRLREMQPLDRSLLLAQYEHIGGMSYDHIIDRHREAMDRTLDTANVILEARQK